MPELIEIEQYRQHLDGLVGQTVKAVEVCDVRVVRPKGDPGEHFSTLYGCALRRTRRHGKLLLADFGEGDSVIVLGLRFGMTGRLLIDGQSSIRQLEYSSPRNDPAWDRFKMTIGASSVVLRDQRCLGSVELEPDVSNLGAEASTITAEELTEAFRGRHKAVKAALLDQSILAGLGNLLADEALWASGISPLTPVDELTAEGLDTLASEILNTVSRLTASGGSNTCESFVARHRGAVCPRCLGQMSDDLIGGRRAWWCPAHQR